jgi:5'-nucleotidase / UDP-sugar diphosphatase
MMKSAKAAIFFFCSFFLLPALLLAQQVSLTILHTNDIHSHLLPFSYPSTTPPGSDIAPMKVRAGIGGIARRSTLVKRLREELEKKGTTVWLMDAGDFFEGTPFSTVYHGEADAAAMNAAGYDIGALGNHDFNTTLSNLKSLLGLFKYPILCANAVEKSTGALLTRASDIRAVGPLTIGIFGLVTKDASDYPAAREGITITDEVETARNMVKALRPQTNVIIDLSHSGETVDRKIASSVPGIDIIVGGHTHSRLPVGEFVWHSDELKAGDVNGTIIVQAYQWGGDLGRLDLLFGKDTRGVWHVERYRASLIPVTPDIPEDPSVAAVVDKFWKPIAARFGEIIGQAAADFIERGDDLAPYNLMADSIRDAFKTDIELENMGGIRAPIIKGKITREDLITLDPFDNTVVTFKITGRALKNILKSQRPAVSGIRYRIENGVVVKATVAGKPLIGSQTYTGSTNSYFARRFLKDIIVQDTGKMPVDVLADYIRKKGTVHPVYDGRRVILN